MQHPITFILDLIKLFWLSKSYNPIHIDPDMGVFSLDICLIISSF